MAKTEGVPALANALRRVAKQPRLSSLSVPLLDDAADALDELRAALARVEAERDDGWAAAKAAADDTKDYFVQVQRAEAAEARCRQLEDARCDCGGKLTVCSDCAVADYQAAHTECATCCPVDHTVPPQEPER